jgi:hypothetical protein
MTDAHLDAIEAQTDALMVLTCTDVEVPDEAPPPNSVKGRYLSWLEGEGPADLREALR